MANTRTWNFLSWNVQGINSQEKWDHIRDKIHESVCSIVSIQGKKRKALIKTILRNFAPELLINSAFPHLLVPWVVF